MQIRSSTRASPTLTQHSKNFLNPLTFSYASPAYRREKGKRKKKRTIIIITNALYGSNIKRKRNNKYRAKFFLNTLPSPQKRPLLRTPSQHRAITPWQFSPYQTKYIPPQPTRVVQIQAMKEEGKKKGKEKRKEQCPNIHKTGVHLSHRTTYDSRDAPPFEIRSQTNGSGKEQRWRSPDGDPIPPPFWWMRFFLRDYFWRMTYENFHR